MRVKKRGKILLRCCLENCCVFLSCSFIWGYTRINLPLYVYVIDSPPFCFLGIDTIYTQTHTFILSMMRNVEMSGKNNITKFIYQEIVTIKGKNTRKKENLIAWKQYIWIKERFLYDQFFENFKKKIQTKDWK